MDKLKCTFFSEMTEFRLGKSSWRNSVREKNALAIVRALASCVRAASKCLQAASSYKRHTVATKTLKGHRCQFQFKGCYLALPTLYPNASFAVTRFSFKILLGV